jgi:hypothetical protein
MRQNPVNAERLEKSDDTQPTPGLASGLAKENDCTMPTAFDRFRPAFGYSLIIIGRSDAGSPVK